MTQVLWSGAVLGLLVVGMGVGAAAAMVWIYAGGSVFLAFALYALVATAFVLGAALLSFVISERKAAEADPAEKGLHPAE